MAQVQVAKYVKRSCTTGTKENMLTIWTSFYQRQHFQRESMMIVFWFSINIPYHRILSIKQRADPRKGKIIMINVGMELPSDSVDSTLRTAQLFTQSTISTNVFQKILISKVLDGFWCQKSWMDFVFKSPWWILISKVLDGFWCQKSLIDFDFTSPW